MVFEPNGMYTSTAATDDRAFQDLVEYVRKKWQENYAECVAPADNEALVEQYFA
jgi:hypothetical protein